MQGGTANVAGIYFVTAGSVTNSGLIASGQGPLGGSANGIVLHAGGVVTNNGTGTISGGGIFAQGAATITNSGQILGDSVYGGIVTNLAGGVISYGGADYGIEISGSATVTNAGTITAGSASGTAVVLAYGYTNRVIVDPGAVFIGQVIGGTPSDTTLELATGASAGTIANLATFSNFGTLTFDPSAAWVVSGASTGLLSTAIITGFAAGDTIDLKSFAATGKIFSNNKLVLSGSGPSETLSIQGSFVAGQFLLSSDSAGGTDIVLSAAPLNYGQTIVETGILAASETVSAGAMTLFDAGTTAVGTITVGTSLSTGDFVLA